ncbi:GntR family transcriptional regulator [Nocardia sp. CDC186]|uniref:GntR family transcriptional regulator n=1 Tax=Nocardia implantans TaxID=3108168 RepID=A0ABU6AXI0_9NOCA|nr:MULTISPECIES: GntR family transcriptional regulator [unclassified Nocardia]MEA3529594.1 GntR family transcriptional regulator [Nocardia sp. CDC192]MEB3512180.1 GntR family transcriptional regulator [Nocardia sp. CDC186]
MSETQGLERGTQGKAIAMDQLRRAIRQGEVAPGQRLVEAELVEQFGVTRGSVRAAIDELVAEGLVERIHNRGARVRKVSRGAAIEILECRKVLEGLIAAKAAQHATAADRDRLREYGEQLTAAVRDGEPMKYSSLNHELHAALRDIAGQATAADLIDRLNAQIVRHQFQLSLRPGRPQVSLREHLAVVEAVVRGDSAGAEQAMRNHLDSVIAALDEWAEQAP